MSSTHVELNKIKSELKSLARTTAQKVQRCSPNMASFRQLPDRARRRSCSPEGNAYCRELVQEGYRYERHSDRKLFVRIAKLWDMWHTNFFFGNLLPIQNIANVSKIFVLKTLSGYHVDRMCKTGT